MTPERLRELKFQVRRHMNGEVANIMKDLDDAYKANYGISLQHARDVARAEDLSAPDCDELWQTGWRDLMLIAAAAIRRHDPAPELLARWAATVPTLEMADALPFLTAGGLSQVPTLAAMLLARDQDYDFAMAANFAARAIVARTAETDVQPVAAIATSIMLLAEARAQWTFAETRALSFLARQCCRLASQGHAFDHCAVTAVDRLRQSALARPDAQARALADDIDAEREMLQQ